MENAIWRRFIIKTKDKQQKDALHRLIECKELSRDDLFLILNTVMLNPAISSEAVQQERSV